MNETLKEWLIPGLAVVMIAFGIFGIGGLIEYLNKPETRTVEEVRRDRYRDCVKYRNVEALADCEKFNVHSIGEQNI